MPLQRYDRDHILISCRAVFAEHGYRDSSVSMLAEASGVSKALIFHHFNNKKALYFSILDECITLAKAELNLSYVPDFLDFFAAILSFNRLKLHFYKRNPEAYKLIMEALYIPAQDVSSEISTRYPYLLDWKPEGWKPRFANVRLKQGIDRDEAFELVSILLYSFEDKLMSEVADATLLNEAYELQLLRKLNNFLGMVREGVESLDDDDE